jgi:hypothetical protein
MVKEPPPPPPPPTKKDFYESGNAELQFADEPINVQTLLSKKSRMVHITSWNGPSSPI